MEPPAPFRPRGVDRSNRDGACFYCKQRNGQDVPATTVVHDRRGCVRVCAEHAAWRQTTSFALGHKNCPDGPQA
jgi:hypothetical protein